MFSVLIANDFWEITLRTHNICLLKDFTPEIIYLHSSDLFYYCSVKSALTWTILINVGMWSDKNGLSVWVFGSLYFGFYKHEMFTRCLQNKHRYTYIRGYRQKIAETVVFINITYDIQPTVGHQSALLHCWTWQWVIPFSQSHVVHVSGFHCCPS